MSNYFDNQRSWSWNVSEGKATITTDHGTHTHTLDVSNISVGTLSDPSTMGKAMGDAHRSTTHDKKSAEIKENDMDRNAFLESLRVDQATIDRINETSKNFQKNEANGKKGKDDGGRERGDEGPGSHGRESGNKPNPAAKSASAHSNSGAAKGGSGSGKGGNGSGHGGSGGGHGGSGGGHGGSDGGHGGNGSGGGHGGNGGGGGHGR